MEVSVLHFTLHAVVRSSSCMFMSFFLFFFFFLSSFNTPKRLPRCYPNANIKCKSWCEYVAIAADVEGISFEFLLELSLLFHTCSVYHWHYLHQSTIMCVSVCMYVSQPFIITFFFFCLFCILIEWFLKKKFNFSSIPLVSFCVFRLFFFLV